MNLVTVDPVLAREKFLKTPFTMKHGLADNPLFTLPRLVELAKVRSDARANLPAEGVLFVCAGGVRSQTAGRYAEERGVKRVYSLTGGTSSWAKAGLPLSSELSIAV